MFSINGSIPLEPYINKSGPLSKRSINCGFLWPYENTKINKLYLSEESNSSYIHYLNFKPYQMEGFSRVQRKVLSKERIMIKIFSRSEKY